MDAATFLRRLRSSEAPDAWAEFLSAYTPLILQVVRLCEREEDHVADCYLFVCEQLSRKHFQRLRRFRLNGSASFPTWLRTVVRNLCLDWHRKEFGRHRIFQSVAQMGTREQEVFRSLFWSRSSIEETLLSLQPRFPSLTKEKVSRLEERFRRSLTSRQLWLLSVRRSKLIQSTEGEVGGEGSITGQIADPTPGPEALVSSSQQRAVLEHALAQLPKFDRLLVRLRFERNMTLEQIRHLTGLGSPRTVDRRIQDILGHLRKKIS